ncbi:MAG: xanthine dehydrogenase family protein subunit M [Anaerolineae bacterium]|nr:xanthine dehydrogenase family protein subunit M [Anaerolineae bacterium]
MQPFDYYRPESFEEAFELLSQPRKTAVAIAGGTDVIPQTRDGIRRPDLVVDIKGLPGMRDLAMTSMAPCCGAGPDECLYVGAAVRINEIARSSIVQDHWPILADAAASIGNEQIRNRATIGGNICTASPAADSAPALYVLDASVLIKGPRGEDRCLPIAQFFTGPKRNALKHAEIVAGLLIPGSPAGTLSFHEKLSRRKAGDLSIVSVAVMAFPSANSTTWRLALGAVGPTPVRAPEAEAILARGYDAEAVDLAAASAYGCCSPIGDIRSSLDYRQAMVVNLARKAIRAVVAQLPQA